MSRGSATGKRLDVITIGRCSVDLYGQQIGSRLEDVASFAKSVGGCPSNIAIGAARLGLNSGLITRVGDEQMGRFVKEQMAREGVALDGIVTDPDRLTSLVLLSVEDDKTFPLIFYRDNCADSALSESDIDEDFVKSSASVLVTGTHFARPHTDAAQRKAMRIARAHGAKVILDIDYRPNLWGLAGLGAGEERYIRSDKVSGHMKSILPDCDLIVGTEEEVHIAAGTEDTLEALRTIRKLSGAVIVLKRGPMGCVVYPGAIPDAPDQGLVGKGFPIEVYNVLGAGDSFMSGFLRGWLRGEDHATSATWANACGAFAVSRLLCSPEIPTWEELQFFLTHGSAHKALRKDEAINHVHWATTRRQQPEKLLAFAIDHRMQMEKMADDAGAPRARLNGFKRLAVKAIGRVAKGEPGYGTLLDDVYGREAMFDAAKLGLWVGRPLEQPGSRPLRFEFTQDVGARLVDWPVTHTVKCLAFYHPDDPREMKDGQAQKLRTLYEAARKVGRELLVEIIAGKNGLIDDTTVARAMTDLYALGIKPDWWKLEPQASATAWENIAAAIRENDPWCRGVLLLGLDAPEEELARGFEAAAGQPIVKGFAVGRTIFSNAAQKWLRREMDDEQAVADMAARFQALADIWNGARRTA
ncbi:5-dehydro-2-deoxygluconokinase [Aestuariivirga sp.]|uniref:bifunctional 5-dehydro-2-deoxygluconokinase/5-dehydro-2- deoxyphosphogluconate aldolase n=1 Tax=Aestuariivirga sp. TaxID=2650926 RepID=UPI0025BC020E|nr:5-dehydro-2-deoxygluconokinase [Aestuariivirga sp.]MCA3555469.1 5-dehydro-2-deoxygluconokinase [Aestuariivirga sp.]